jgi:transposase-like protein
VTCHNCQSLCRKFGKHRNGLQRYRCNQCRKTFTEDHATPLDTMRLPMDKAKLIIKLLCEGCSIRSIERLTLVHRDTIMRLLLLAGERCTRLMKHQFTTVEVHRIQCDELHCFVGKRERRTSIEESDEVGEQYTFIAMDADTKLVFSWLTGKRSPVNTYTFMRDVYDRMPWSWQPQLTTDGWGPYPLLGHYLYGGSVLILGHSFRAWWVCALPGACGLVASSRRHPMDGRDHFRGLPECRGAGAQAGEPGEHPGSP